MTIPPLTTSNWDFVVVLAAAFFAIYVAASLRRFLQITRPRAFVLGLLMTVFAVIVGIQRIYEMTNGSLRRHFNRGDEIANTVQIVSPALFVFFLVPFIVKLYRAWMGIAITAEERAPGAVGVRAWMTPTNLLLALFIAALAEVSLDFSFAGVLLLLLAALLACPAINTFAVQSAINTSSPQPAPVPASETLSPEREKVLAMLEAGKITAEESAELLNALAATTRLPTPATLPITPQRRLVLIGAGLLLLSFFLPWYSFNPGQELNRMTGQMQGMMQGMFLNAPITGGSPPNLQFSQNFSSPTVHVSGGDIPHGLGWLVLLIAAGVAFLPQLAPQLDARRQRLFTLAALALGGLVLVYLLTTDFRHANIGLALAVIAFALEVVGTLRSESSLFAVPRPIAHSVA